MTVNDMPSDEEIYCISELFKVFADQTRAKILFLLCDNELCVNDIAKHLDMSQSSISHQLRILKQSRLVKFRRDGKTLYYSLCDNHVKTMLNQGLEHISE
jgi:ArsR family transcriptional regulator